MGIEFRLLSGKSRNIETQGFFFRAKYEEGHLSLSVLNETWISVQNWAEVGLRGRTPLTCLVYVENPLFVHQDCYSLRPISIGFLSVIYHSLEHPKT